MSCYEQFSLSSEIDVFFRKMNELPTYLRDYAHSLIKEHVANPLPVHSAKSYSLSNDEKRQVAECEEGEKDALERTEVILSSDVEGAEEEDTEQVELVESSGEDALDAVTEEHLVTKNDLHTGDSEDSDIDIEVIEEQIEDYEDSESDHVETIEGIECVTELGESVPDVSYVEEVISCGETPLKTSDHSCYSLPIVIRDEKKLNAVKPTNKVALNVGKNDSAAKKAEFQIVKTLKRRGNGSLYYATSAVLPLGRVTQNVMSVVTKGTEKPVNNLPNEATGSILGNLLNSNSSPTKNKRKEAQDHLTYGLGSKHKTILKSCVSVSAANEVTEKNKQLQKRNVSSHNMFLCTKAQDKPKLDIDVGSDNQVILRNSSAIPIAFVSDPNIIVQKPNESGTNDKELLDSVTTKPNFPIAYLSRDKIVVPGRVGINSQTVRNKVRVKELGSKSVTNAKKSSDPKAVGNSPIVRYRTILPASPSNATQFVPNNGEILKEIQFLPNSWGKPVAAPNSSVTIQVNNKVGSNIHVKNKNSPPVPVKVQKPTKLDSNIAVITKRLLASKNSKLTVRAVRSEKDKKKRFHLGPKEREALAKQLSKYFRKNKEGEKEGAQSEEEFVVVIDPNDIIRTDQCNIVEPTGMSSVTLKKHRIRKNVCEKCGKVCTSATKLKIHLQSHLPKFKCKKCGEAFYTREEHYLHKVEHKDQEIHTCEFCKIQFNQFIRLKEHIRLNHPTQKLHKCSKCDYTTYTQKTLDSHIRYKHVPKRQLPQLICPVCRKVYHQTSELKNHITTHLSEKIFKCDICQKAFSQKTTLRSHQRNVHGERRYPCNICSMILKTRDNQIRHMASHSNAKLFPCPYCSYACNSQGNLVKHVRTQHNVANFSLRKKEHSKPVALESDPAVDQGVKKAEMITRAYLNKLSKKLGRTITAPLSVEQRESEDSVNILAGSDENSEFTNHTASSSSQGNEEEAFGAMIETETAVSSLEKESAMYILPETQRMLDDLIQEATPYTC